MQSPQDYIRSFVRLRVKSPETVRIRVREDPLQIEVELCAEDLARITQDDRESIAALCCTMGLKRGSFNLKFKGV